MFGNTGGFLSDAFSAYTSHREAEMSRDFNELEAQKKREWDERMANTQYQRTVADLNAAGLSPMLAITKGATALPSGATASSGAVGTGVKFGETEGRMSQSAMARQQVELAKSQEQLNIQTAKQVAEQARKTAYEVDTMLPTQLVYDMAVKGSQITANNATALSSTANARDTNARANLTEQGKAPAPDTGVVRNIKDAYKYGIQAPNDFFTDMISNVRKYYKGK